MTIPAQVYQLVEPLDQNLAAYKQGQYNETQVRMQYIDPFFKALGWDMRNEKGLNEVVPEEAIKVGRATKFPDYSFRTGPHDQDRKFFLEAKKPSVDIEHDTHPAYQLRRYAWSAKLPIRTIDFDNPTDKARHDEMVALVEQMLNLHKQLNEAKVPQQKTMLKRQIEATDRQIDNLVYELYGLTDEEIKIVEGQASNK